MIFSKIGTDSVCAIVVTFRPDLSFDGYLKKIQSQFSSTYIVDNGSKGTSRDMLLALQSTNVHLLEMGRNTGLGVALNRGIRIAASNGYRWAVLFDQDTEPVADMVTQFNGVLSKHPNAEKVAVIGSQFHDRNRCDTSSYTSRRADSETNEGFGWKERRRVITSGSLISIKAYSVIGPFREDLFIDSIDHEYCYRARLKGWLVLQTTSVLVTHTVGNYKRHRILGFSIWRSHHSAMRCYFINRNKMLLARERRQYRKILRGGVNAAKNAIFVLAFEEDKMAKIKAIFSGYVDGVANRRIAPSWIMRDFE